MTTDGYMGRRDASAYLSLSLRKMDGLIDEIPSFLIGGKRLFRKSELDGWLEGYRSVSVGRIVDDVVRSVLEEK